MPTTGARHDRPGSCLSLGKGRQAGCQSIRQLIAVNGVQVVLEDGTWAPMRASSNKPELVAKLMKAEFSAARGGANPIAIGAVGGSGTRMIAKFMTHVGRYVAMPWFMGECFRPRERLVQ